MTIRPGTRGSQLLALFVVTNLLIGVTFNCQWHCWIASNQAAGGGVMHHHHGGQAAASKSTDFEQPLSAARRTVGDVGMVVLPAMAAAGIGGAALQCAEHLGGNGFAASATYEFAILLARLLFDHLGILTLIGISFVFLTPVYLSRLERPPARFLVGQAA